MLEPEEGLRLHVHMAMTSNSVVAKQGGVLGDLVRS